VNWLAFSESVVTLFVIMDPIGTVPVFVALTAQRSPSQRRWAAVQSSALAGVLIVAFALFGRILLDYLNVSVESLALAGGLLLLPVALEMFTGQGDAPRGEVNVVLVPLRIDSS
jgi:multiple antibiotic resistance protein